MDTLLKFIEPALAWWRSLGQAGPYYLWIAVGVVGLLLWSWAAYYVIRRLLGHKRHFGVWFKPQELEEWLDRMQAREKEGSILKLEEVALLDLYRFDRKLHLKKIGDADYHYVSR